MAASSVVEHWKHCVRLGLAMTKCSNQGISMRPCIEKPCFILMSELRSEGCCLPAHLRSVITRPPSAVGIDDVLQEIHVVSHSNSNTVLIMWSILEISRALINCILKVKGCYPIMDLRNFVYEFTNFTKHTKAISIFCFYRTEQTRQVLPRLDCNIK